MAVKLSISQDEIFAHLLGDIDHHTAKEMREEIDAAIHRIQAKSLTLDFSGVEFMDSSGIGLVMGRYKLINSYGGSLNIINASERIKKMMYMAGMDKLAIINDGGKVR